MRIRYFNISILVCITFLTSVKSYGQDTENIFDYWLNEYTVGYERYEKGDFTNAIPHFTNALNVSDQIDFSTNNETEYYPINNQNYLGVCYFRLEQYENAATHFEGTLKQIDILKTENDSYYNQVLENLINSYTNFDLQKTIDTRKTLLKRLKTKDLNYAQQLFSLAFNYKNVNDELQFNTTLIEVDSILRLNNATNNDFYAYTSYYLGNYYFSIDDYKASSFYFSKAENLVEFLKTDESINIIDITFLNGVALLRQDDFEMAALKFESILDAPYYKQPENITLYIQLVDYYANVLQKLGQTKKAETVHFNSLAFLLDNNAENTEIYAMQNINLGEFYLNSEDITNAEKHLHLAKTIYEKLGVSTTNDYFILLNYLGQLNYFKGNYKVAEGYYLNALNLYDKLDDKVVMNKLNVESNLALVYQNTGVDDYDKAQKLHLKVLQNKKEILGDIHSDYGISLMNYGNFLIETGDYLKAEQQFNKALSIFKTTIGSNSLMYAKQLLNLGQFYYTTRQTKNSLEAFNEAIKIYTANQSQESYGMALALAGKGLNIQFLGETDNALEFQLKGFEILKNNANQSHIDYGKIAVNIGACYYIKGNYTEALSYYKKALESYKTSLNEGHYLYGTLLTNIAEALINSNQIPAAIENLDKALNNFSNNYGIDSYYYGTALAQKGVALFKAKKYKESISILEQAQPIIAKYTGEESDLFNQLLFHLAVNYEALGNNDKATELYLKNYKGFKKELKDVFTYRSENEKKDFLRRFETTLSWLSNSVFNSHFQNEALLTTGLNNQLLLKGLLLNTTKDLLAELSNNGDENVKLKIENYRQLRQQREKYLNSISKYKESILDSIKTQLNNLEIELVKLHSTNLKLNTDNFNKDWTQIKSNLKSNEIALEFTNYTERVDNTITNTKVYGVYLIYKDWDQPKIIELFKEEDLKAILKSQNPNTLYQTRGSKSKSTTNTKGLYELIWSPIEASLKGIETVYFSPSGLLNQIPFAALDTEGKPILASQYQMVQLSSTYKITEINTGPKSNTTLFIGGITYDFIPSKTKAESKDTISQLSILKSVSDTRSLGAQWNYLAGTLEEVNSIASLFSKKDKDYSSFTGANASETRFKNLSGNAPNIIHIATHGFFFENPKTRTQSALNTAQKNSYTINADPLLRSGLLFSGSNYAWQNGSNPHIEDDGILTALEISNLDLSNTDLVVLSACETGLGDIDGSEGVYGLQRAFKMAGVDIIVMSLWEVPDAETSEFMTTFYTNWLSGQKIRTAFRNTQLTMAKTYKDHPEKWAAFVLFE
ncbi:CHAT domain-containing protein [Winogradskyella thalassocola]|uniref:Tetratricopeptide repeat-containing protein n=1 Tax=Winogradskyella thalassocola TaxID=262004 RepID=A0A1G7YYR6_9FLAO|nr:CHAT domain-containing protein [Winogradskyella thalassocola]SDH01000.1 Tetratricopeptide repeat-containing protein [Winogradskyella thalassocola]